MTENDVLKVIMQRLGPGWPLPAVSGELQGVLLDISSRADFLTAEGTIATIDGQSEYDLPENLKNVYEVSIEGGSVLDKKTYRQYLNHWDGLIAPTKAEPTEYAIRHKKLYLWPVPDGVYTVNMDYSIYHPAVFTDVLFGSEFNEAIYEGVLAQLLRGQLKAEAIEKKADAELHTNTFEKEISKLISNLDVETETVLVEYRDI